MHRFVFRHINSNTQVSASELNPLPFTSASIEQQIPIIGLIDQILAAKSDNPKANTSALEWEIDQLAYALKAGMN